MKVAVVGAGIAGLAAAYRLQERNHDVTVYEATDRAGGRGKLLNRPGTDDWADVGTQYFHSNYSHALKLIDDIGLSPKLKKISGGTRMFTAADSSFDISPKRPWMKPGGIGGNLKLGAYVARLLMRLKSSNYSAEPHQAIYDGKAAIDSTDDAFVRDYLVRLLSLVGGMSEPSLANISLLQIYRLVKIIMLTDYVSLEGGTATLHEALSQRLDIRYESPVARLLEDARGVSGIELADGETVPADHVVVAAHPPKAAEIVPDCWEEEKAFLGGIEMPPAVIVSFFLDRALEKGVWTYFFPFDQDGPVSFCLDTHQKSPDTTPSGKATLQAWILAPKAEGLIHQDDDQIAERARRNMETYLPGISEAIEGHTVTRHWNAIPQSSVGHNIRALDFLEAIDRRDGVSFCGDYLSGGYLECALWSVDRALGKLDGNRSAAPQDQIKEAARLFGQLSTPSRTAATGCSRAYRNREIDRMTQTASP